MRAVAMPMAEPPLEFHQLPDPGFLIQGFLIQGPRAVRSHFGSSLLGRARGAGRLGSMAAGGRHRPAEWPARVRHLRREEDSRLGASAARREARRRGRIALERGLWRALGRPEGLWCGAALGALGDEVARRERLSRPTLVAGVIGARPRPGQVLVRNCAQHAAILPEDGAPLSAWRLAELGPRLGEQLEEPTTMPDLPKGRDVADLESELLAREAAHTLDEDDGVDGFSGESAALASSSGDFPGEQCIDCLAPGVWLVDQHAAAKAFSDGLSAGWRLAEQLERQQALDAWDELKESLEGICADINGTLQFSGQVREGAQSHRSVHDLRGFMSVWRTHDKVVIKHVMKLRDAVNGWGGLARPALDGALASGVVDTVNTVEGAVADRQSEGEEMQLEEAGDILGSCEADVASAAASSEMQLGEAFGVGAEPSSACAVAEPPSSSASAVRAFPVAQPEALLSGGGEDALDLRAGMAAAPGPAGAVADPQTHRLTQREQDLFGLMSAFAAELHRSSFHS